MVSLGAQTEGDCPFASTAAAFASQDWSLVQEQPLHPRADSTGLCSYGWRYIGLETGAFDQHLFTKPLFLTRYLQ